MASGGVHTTALLLLLLLLLLQSELRHGQERRHARHAAPQVTHAERVRRQLHLPPEEGFDPQ
jgi:hypothetical protein